ncbi:MAG TPA: pyroglutamyl-peptidase I [Chloroflexia bacterium]|nr:pyroglutamyl-peptidase I [Chloroflexia bacterium]
MAEMTETQPPRLLLTGFAPFGDFPMNPSWELARRFQGERVEMVDVETAQLPVDWAAAWPALQAAIERVDPTWVLMLGLARTRTAVSVEVRARNYTTPVRDTAHALPPANDLVEESGPEYRISTIPAPLLVERLQEAGVPAEVSTDAGSYLCNWVLYKALAYAESHTGLQGVGFIHIPPVAEQGGTALTLDQLERGLARAVDSLVAGRAPLFSVVAGEIAAERARAQAEETRRGPAEETPARG